MVKVKVSIEESNVYSTVFGCSDADTDDEEENVQYENNDDYEDEEDYEYDEESDF